MKSLLNPYSELRNTKGETLIELLISLFILSITLTVIISIFISGRAGIVESWKQTKKNECAASVMEQLKSLPYETLFQWENDFSSAGEAANIRLRHPVVKEQLGDRCADAYEVQFDLLQYKTYPLSEIMVITVRVRTDEKEKWVEISSLMRKGDSSS